MLKISLITILILATNIICFSQRELRETIVIPDYIGYTIDSSLNFDKKIIKGMKMLKDEKEIISSTIVFSGGRYTTTFKRKIEFDLVSFLDITKFESAEFQDTVIFHACNFKKSVTFEQANFRKVLYISNTKFKESPNFNSAQLPKLFMFVPSGLDSLKGVIDFTNCRTDSLKKYRNIFTLNGDKCRIVLNSEEKRNSDVLKLFFKKVILPSQLFTLQFVPLIDPFDSHDNHTQLYEGLINQSKELGMIESEQGWRIEYEKYKISNTYDLLEFNFTLKGHKYMSYLLPLGTVMNFINEKWWNFGYSKSRILFFWLPFFFILFVFINYLKLDWMVKHVYNEGSYGKNFRLKYENNESRYDRFSYSLFYTAMIFFNFRLDSKAVNYKNLKGLLYLYLIYVIGTIHVAFGIIGYIFK